MNDDYQQLINSGKLSSQAVENLKLWINDRRFAEFCQDLEILLKGKDIVQIEDAFYKHIEIGTGGIRGPIGVGPNRINLQTIGEAAQGLANFIEDFGSEAKEKGVVVGHEVRKMSRPFAEMCCSIFAANGIKSYLFDSLRATPEVSFAVRHLGATAGVQLTASHNPRTDNGFKFYWSDGGQVVPPADLKFMELVASVGEIKKIDFEKAVESGLIKIVGHDIDVAYINEIKNLTLSKSRSAKIVFSPIHGAGITNVLPVLTQESFDVQVVPEQEKPDENFPTAVGDLINPEYPEVMQLAIKLAEKTSADIAINSDPDSDRLGIAAKISLDKNELQFLTGNEVGVAMCHFILTKLKEKNKLNENSLVIETNVTTTLISDIAKSFNIKVVDDLLVGFKFIGEIIEQLENKEDFVFAAEESLGYLRGTFVRDKDAAISAFTISELVSDLKDNGKTLVEYLNEIYQKFGYYKNRLFMAEMKGKVGFLNTGRIMMGLRNTPPKVLAGFKIIKVIDRLPREKAVEGKYKTGSTGDQLAFILGEDERVKVTVRPSGTEPKIKYYIQVYSGVNDNLDETKVRVDTDAENIEKAILKEATKFIQSE